MSDGVIDRDASFRHRQRWGRPVWTDESTPEPGWYRDPLQPGRWRYWYYGWTALVRAPHGRRSPDDPDPAMGQAEPPVGSPVDHPHIGTQETLIEQDELVAMAIARPRIEHERMPARWRIEPDVPRQRIRPNPEINVIGCVTLAVCLFPIVAVVSQALPSDPGELLGLIPALLLVPIVLTLMFGRLVIRGRELVVWRYEHVPCRVSVDEVADVRIVRWFRLHSQNAPFRWMPELVLRDGRRIKLNMASVGPFDAPPDPIFVTFVDDLRHLLGLQPLADVHGPAIAAIAAPAENSAEN